MNLIVVSNRVSSLSDKSAAAGGLAAALYQGMRASGGTWFGWSGKLVEGEPGPATITPAARAKLATIDYPEDDFTGFYNGMANGTLWPVMHNRVDLMVYDPAYLEKYQRINRLVAGRIAQLETPDAFYWIHGLSFPDGRVVFAAGGRQTAARIFFCIRRLGRFPASNVCPITSMSSAICWPTI